MAGIIAKGIAGICDFYRTAPLGNTLFLVSAGQMAFTYDSPFGVVFGVSMGVVSAVEVGIQFELRKRLEQSVSEYGYSAREFLKTIPEWCDRQTARVVARRHGHLDDYVALCESHKAALSFPNLIDF